MFGDCVKDEMIEEQLNKIYEKQYFKFYLAYAFYFIAIGISSGYIGLYFNSFVVVASYFSFFSLVLAVITFYFSGNDLLFLDIKKDTFMTNEIKLNILLRLTDGNLKQAI